MKNRFFNCLFAYFTVFVVLFLINICMVYTYGYGFENKKYDFEHFSEQDSIDFVSHYNITIPSILQKKQIVGFVTQNIIQSVYRNPSHVFAYNYEPMQSYANSIKKTMTNSNIYRKESTNTRDLYFLQDSTVKDSSGNWVTNGGAFDERWEDFNCYAFSIHRNEEEGFYQSDFQYQPGDMIDDSNAPGAINTFVDCETIADLAYLVRNDLMAMGYSDVMVHDIIPSITSSQELICVRMCEYDYHFMLYNSATESWYHKPGGTAILKYNYTPSNYITWTNECSYYGCEYEGDLEYGGNIKFITYKKNTVYISSATSNQPSYLEINAGKDSILEIINFSNNNYYQFNINSSYSLDVKLYDVEMNLLYSTTGTNVVICICLYDFIYYLKLNYCSQNNYGTVTTTISSHNHTTFNYFSNNASIHQKVCVACGYSVNEAHNFIYSNGNDVCNKCGYSIVHQHNHNHNYQWNCLTDHKSYCSCGNYILEAHVVSSGAFSLGQQYATCLVCGGLASFGGIIHNGIGLFPHTINGSFILPNGVIVLVDEDYESYLNKTLTFIYPNDMNRYNYILNYKKEKIIKPQ